MRLSSIKLAGFKSFVDPTTLRFPVNMTAIVGPNGCGKSNVIDAVRWVMGESSASRLRGDLLTDVIFSGSSSRAPIGTATVELLFDNADGKLAGEYADFSEVSVRRSVSRDGSSQYWLNGTRCRRRDVTDLFLGTGLGPRSYAIIEQGTISRIIEARPEELRGFLEEAAGISKYKERRRETETRIRHTRENLDRLADVRDEVGRRIDHLARQARQAEQYKKLSDELRTLRAQWNWLSHRDASASIEDERRAIEQAQTSMEALIADLRRIEAKLEGQRIGHGQAQESLSAVQARAYAASADVASIEREIEFHAERREQLKLALGEADRGRAELDSHRATDEAEAGTVAERLRELSGDAAAASQRHTDSEQALNDQEQAFNSEDMALQTLRSDYAASAQIVEVERARLELLDREMLEVSRQDQALATEHGALVAVDWAARLAAMAEAQTGSAAKLGQAEVARDARSASLQGIRTELDSALTSQATVRATLQEALGRLASLETLQRGSSAAASDTLIEWLAQRGVRGVAASSVIKVAEGWEAAVETVLGAWLEALIVDDATALGQIVSALDEHGIDALFAGPEAMESNVGDDSLAALVEGPTAIRRLLAPVRRADSVEQARAIVAKSSGASSAVTAQGEWFGADFLRVTRPGSAQRGVLARQRAIEAEQARLDAANAEDAQLEQTIVRLRTNLRDGEQVLADEARTFDQQQREMARIDAEKAAADRQHQDSRSRVEALQKGRADAEARRASAETEARSARARLDTALQEMASLDGRRREAESRRRELETGLAAARREAAEARIARQTLEVETGRLEARRQALHAQRQRTDQQLAQLGTQRDSLAQQMRAVDAPDQALVGRRSDALEAREGVDRELTAARVALDSLVDELRELDRSRQQADVAVAASREALQGKRLEANAAEVRAEAFVATIRDIGLDFDEIGKNLTEDAGAADWHSSIEKVDARLRRLEPVNLAAIGEHAEHLERKTYLDAQHEDLTQALETLETAIRRIDKETRGRFKDTFEKVNSGLGRLFPQLFGGGHAYLDLTDEDLLETGVTLMARPPGKRVSNISLLSGGEKAMTAVALVFAIFELNPAPFCLLDEVDAPLDEANVGRFSDMLRSLAERVQFVIVTHNKSTMEAVHQLVGVTMREPGVSRLVSVDLDEATKLAATA